MLHEIPCRCGDRKKRFKINIGEFYIDECCTEKGFDHLGNLKTAEGEKVDLSTLEQKQVEDTAAVVSVNTPLAGPPQPKHTKPSSASFLKNLIGLKPGRGKLRDLNRDELVKMATERNLEVKEGATKNELIALLLG